MSLRYALLALLIDGEATGYELAKSFDRSVANFWHALPQQLYAELTRMEQDGLIEGEVVVQQTRPNKRIFSMTEAGRRELSGWFDEPVRLSAFKDELLVRVYAADLVAPETIIDLLEEQTSLHEQKLQHYEALRELMFRGRIEEEFLRTTRRVGPYLSLKNGIGHERSSLDWLQWAKDAMQLRLEGRGAAQGASRRPRVRAGDR